MGGVIWLLKSAAFLPFVAEAVVAGLFYLSVLVAMRTFSPSEVAFARHFLTVRNLRAAFVPRKEGAQ
jgi:hypothetical protein